jgi:hypothetical protein
MTKLLNNAQYFALCLVSGCRYALILNALRELDFGVQIANDVALPH